MPFTEVLRWVLLSACVLCAGGALGLAVWLVNDWRRYRQESGPGDVEAVS